MSDRISTAFLQRAAEVLSEALSGSQIVSVTSAFAADFDRDIPHATYPFKAYNKKTALFENLQPFSAGKQYQVIYELCDRVSTNPAATSQQKINASQLKLTLLSRYYQFSSDTSSNKGVPLVVTEVRHWLSDFPVAKKTYEEASSAGADGSGLALFERSEFSQTPAAPSNAAYRRSRAMNPARLFFGDFLLAKQKKVTAQS